MPAQISLGQASQSPTPPGQGRIGLLEQVAARAAFRKGTACYCGYHNEVVPGMWSGGIVGLKSILGVRRRAQALQIMDQLQSLGYIKYSLDQKTKRLDYQICDWVISCSGQGCSAGTVYATDGYKSGRDFDFEEEKLSEAFRTLPLMKRRILTMLFVEQLSPREIASHLNCSVQYVYNQRSLALKSLRRIIANRSDDA